MFAPRRRPAGISTTATPRPARRMVRRLGRRGRGTGPGAARRRRRLPRAARVPARLAASSRPSCTTAICWRGRDEHRLRQRSDAPSVVRSRSFRLVVRSSLGGGVLVAVVARRRRGSVPPRPAEPRRRRRSSQRPCSRRDRDGGRRLALAAHRRDASASDCGWSTAIGHVLPVPVPQHACSRAA